MSLIFCQGITPPWTVSYILLLYTIYFRLKPVHLLGMLGELPDYSGPLLELWAYLLLLISSLNLALRQLIASAENYVTNIVTNVKTRTVSIFSTVITKFLLCANQVWSQCLRLLDWFKKRSTLVKKSVGSSLKWVETGLEKRVRAALETTLVVLRCDTSFEITAMPGSITRNSHIFSVKELMKRFDKRHSAKLT